MRLEDTSAIMKYNKVCGHPEKPFRASKDKKDALGARGGKIVVDDTD